MIFQGVPNIFAKIEDINDQLADSVDVRVINTLVTVEYDEIVLTYIASGNGEGEIETVTYKENSITVATLTLSYDGDNKLTSVVRS